MIIIFTYFVYILLLLLFPPERNGLPG